MARKTRKSRKNLTLTSTRCRELFIAVGLRRADKWPLSRLTTKINSLDDMVDQELRDQIEDEDIGELVDDVLAVLEGEGKVTVEEEDDEAPTRSRRKKKSEPVDEDEADSDGDADEDDDDDDEEEEDEPKPKSRKKSRSTSRRSKAKKEEPADDDDDDDDDVEDADDVDKALENMTLRELKTYARNAKIELTGTAARSKAKAREAIEAAEKAARSKKSKGSKSKSKTTSSKGKAVATKAGGNGKPGIIGSIVEFLEKASEDRPITKKQLGAKLAKRFAKDETRTAEGMMKTVQAQVPNRLRKQKGLNVLTDDEGGFWIEDEGDDD